MYFQRKTVLSSIFVILLLGSVVLNVLSVFGTDFFFLIYTVPMPITLIFGLYALQTSQSTLLKVWLFVFFLVGVLGNAVAYAYLKTISSDAFSIIVLLLNIVALTLIWAIWNIVKELEAKTFEISEV